MALRRSFEEIEQVSVRLRQKLGIDALLCPDLLLVLERKLASVFPGFQFIRMPDAELPEAPAKADCVAKTITVRESIAQQAIYGSGYARMTLAHEIAHIALGLAVRYGKGACGKRVIADVRREKPEAKRLAAVFLCRRTSPKTASQ